MLHPGQPLDMLPQPSPSRRPVLCKPHLCLWRAPREAVIAGAEHTLLWGLQQGKEGL